MQQSTWQRFVAAVRYVLALEPVRVQAVWRGVIVLLTSVGVVVSDATIEQGLGIIGAVYALVEVVSALRTRARVTPTAKLPPAVLDAVSAGPLPGSPASVMLGESVPVGDGPAIFPPG